MSELISHSDLVNAKTDADTLADLMTGPASPGTVTNRVGDTLYTYAKIQALGTVAAADALMAANDAMQSAASAGADLWSRPVSSIVASEPSSPSIGDRVLLSGSNATHPNQVAEYFSGGWHYSGAPLKGQLLWIQETAQPLQFIEDAWSLLPPHYRIPGYAALRSAFPSGVPFAVGASITIHYPTDTRADGEFEIVSLSSSGYTDDGGWTIIDNAGRVWRRVWTSLARPDWYLPTLGTDGDATAAINGAVAATKEICGFPGFEIVTPGIYALSTASADPVSLLDIHTSGARGIPNGCILPNIKYKVSQTSSGGKVTYAGTDYMDGQTFVGKHGYEGAKYSNALLDCVVAPAVAIDADGTNKIHIKTPGPDAVEFHVKDAAAANDGTPGVGLMLYDSSGLSAAKLVHIEGGFAVSGIADLTGATDLFETPQIGLLCVNNTMATYYDHIYVKAILCGALFVDCWNTHLTKFSDQTTYCGMIHTNNNQNTIGSVWSAGIGLVGHSIMVRDSDGEDFNSAGVTIGDELWTTLNDKSGVLKCKVKEVGWWDGSSTNNDILICQVQSLSKEVDDLALFTGGFQYLFNSGAGTSLGVLTTDLNKTTYDETRYTDAYKCSRVCGGYHVIAKSIEGFNISGGQITKAGIGIRLYASGNAQSAGGNTGPFSIMLESEGPTTAMEVCFEPYQSVTANTFMGLPGGLINVGGTAAQSANGSGASTMWGRTQMIYGDGLVNCTIMGTCQSPRNPNYGLVLTRNSYNNNTDGFVSFDMDSSIFARLNLQAGTDSNASYLLPQSKQSIVSSTGLTGNVSATKVGGSFRSRTSSTNLPYGRTQKTPRLVYLDIDVTPTSITATATDEIVITFTRLDDTSSETATTDTYIVVIGQPEMAGRANKKVTRKAAIPCNVYGNFQYAVTNTGPFTFNLAINQTGAICL